MPRKSHSGNPAQGSWPLKGEGGANWKYLLPIGEESNVFSFEPLGEETMVSLARSVRQLTIVCDTYEQYESLEVLIKERELGNVRLQLPSTEHGNPQMSQNDVILTRGGNRKFRGFFGKALWRVDNIKGIGLIGRTLSRPFRQTILNDYGITEYLALPKALNFRILVNMTNRFVCSKSFNLHNTMKVENRIAKATAVLLSSLGLLRLFFVNRFCVFAKSSGSDDSILLGYLKQKLRQNDIYIALNPGSHGKGNKAVVQVMNSEGEVLAYAKIADNPFGRTYLENERNMLSYLSDFQFIKGEIPLVYDFVKTGNHTILLLSPPKRNARLSPVRLRSVHLDWLLELAKKTSICERNVSQSFIEECYHNYAQVTAFYHFKNEQHLKELFNEALDCVSTANLRYSVTQIDFTPWNIRVTDDKLFVMDWEWAKRFYPPLFDLFHFGFQTNLRLTNMTSVNVARNLFFRKASYSDKLMWFCENLGIERRVAFSLFVLYVFSWMQKGVEIESGTIVEEQAALLNALSTDRDFQKSCFLPFQ